MHAMQEQPRMVVCNVCCFFSWLVVNFFGHFLGDNLYPFASTHCPPWHSVFDFRLESHRLTRVYTNPSLFDDAAPATPFIFQIFWARGNWRWFFSFKQDHSTKNRDDAKTCFLRKKHGETNWKHPVAVGDNTKSWTQCFPLGHLHWCFGGLRCELRDGCLAVDRGILLVWQDPAWHYMALEKSEGLTHTGLTNQPSSMFLV